MNISTTNFIELYETVLTRKGQITVPIGIRKRWRLKRGDKVGFRVIGPNVMLEPKGSVIAFTAGMFHTTKSTKTAERLRREAETAIAKETTERVKP